MEMIIEEMLASILLLPQARYDCAGLPNSTALSSFLIAQNGL
jgi:hypothetical protein